MSRAPCRRAFARLEFRLKVRQLFVELLATLGQRLEPAAGVPTRHPAVTVECEERILFDVELLEIGKRWLDEPLLLAHGFCGGAGVCGDAANLARACCRWAATSPNLKVNRHGAAPGLLKAAPAAVCKASVYGPTPDARLLEPHVAAIDLRVTDPGFEIEKLPMEAVTSVTLMLPEGDAHQRLSALRRFAERLTHYKQRRIWLGVANVRRRAQLEAASRLRIPFVRGPAVRAPLPSPAGGRSIALTNLPLTVREEQVPRPRIASHLGLVTLRRPARQCALSEWPAVRATSVTWRPAIAVGATSFAAAAMLRR